MAVCVLCKQHLGWVQSRIPSSRPAEPCMQDSSRVQGGKYLHWKASLLKKSKIVIFPKLCCGSHLPNEDLPKAALEWQSSKGPPRELRESSRKAFCCLSHRILLWVSRCNTGTEHSLTLHCSESRGDEWYHPPWVTALPPVAFLEDPKTMVQVWVSN